MNLINATSTPPVTTQTAGIRVPVTQDSQEMASNVMVSCKQSQPLLHCIFSFALLNLLTLRSFRYFLLIQKYPNFLCNYSKTSLNRSFAVMYSCGPLRRVVDLQKIRKIRKRYATFNFGYVKSRSIYGRVDPYRWSVWEVLLYLKIICIFIHLFVHFPNCPMQFS